MRTMSRIWAMLVVGVSLGLTIMWVSPAKAVPLTNTEITWEKFVTWADLTVIDYVDTVPFNFAGGDNFPDGYVFTAAYPGIGPAANLWVYVYQVKLNNPADVPVINGMSWLWIPRPSPITDPDLGTITSFKITSISSEEIGELIGMGLGDVDITDADWYPHPTSPTADFDFVAENGEITYIFGLFSSLPPTKVTATIRDSAELVGRPLIFTPTPEPSVFLLFGLGLIGVAIRRRK